MSPSENKLIVHSIESFGTHDGPGIRLVVFLQGCNLQCKYCQNADTIALKGGTPTEFESLVKRAGNMKTYFGDDGGVTVSGGEPMLQSKALIPFFEALKKEGIHSNIDTNGLIRTPEAQHLISDLSDLVMFDVKATTEEGFKSITGAKGLSRLLENIQLREQSQKPYWLRYVLVPDYTDSDESLKWLIETFSGNKYLEKFEILPYHKLGTYKWESLGMDYQLKDVKENTPEQIDRAFEMLKPHFKDVIVK
ncbi:pyruvate formate-lyase-activating protein [uncultured Draconibacterium sp.]|uniref:pyruvate formate-lyase-activating protein n=1 Tax=uncultured Draconibacterium sp. TaxID=1573823 RepID=UPI002AA8772D|nr:pyruvate formate-lyase-activating protein [uncultured Draconibacterium sp.]